MVSHHHGRHGTSRLLTPQKANLILILFLMTPIITRETDAGVLNNLLNRVYSFLGIEYCGHPHVHNAGAKRLQTALKNQLFGQDLAADIVLKSVKGHIDDPNPRKALVLSLHGWPGGGKTFTAQLVMDALYEKGINCSYVRFFLSSHHFPDPDKVQEYHDLVRWHVEHAVKRCPRALFIFDEVHKTLPGILEALAPFIYHPGAVLDGFNYKKAIYIFVSTIGAHEITNITLQAWKDGRKREELTFKDFERELSNEAFVYKSGFYKSRIIDKILVDHFVPYLPLERRHVIQCAKAEAKRVGIPKRLIDKEAEKAADMLSYSPADLKLYSTTECKKVDTFLKYRLAELRWSSTGQDFVDLNRESS